ncbi:anaerobic ribonucleoside-triphosphate reductase activating protein [Sphingobacterium sp. DK4209]|uniref:Anaerobic ribonucleoside-triphosphate reductase activating protein n=1 Tax=Sphingobacterium zhuxiongii TaxID=2662364 RepID=A0A5Q0QHQ9_9SPHI|nr:MULTISPECIES: anaerobic ribonucleoside-triphosphate reductase activating protein [unclassified Sphingobacterium]MVZ64651.1 anaerobic ribonucleoside-triphosphate reductase activating protein [Sphingobacterium sp. DK4209]QGA26990.1 anaerobic ribonucleoside-triphosphate reductase activating protein [Sphingobacterium sp. dk4302]
MVKPLFDITAFSLLDYPNKAACIFWFVGCNMRCQYCYNPDIVFGKGKIAIAEAERFLQARRGLLQAVVMSGGECSIHRDLLTLARIAKDLGYLVKIDTNGASPKNLQMLINEGLVDYVALDFKTLAPNFQEVTGVSTFASFETSFAILQSADIPFEVRTTVHSELLKKDDILQMIDFLVQKEYKGTYYLQLALNDVKTLVELPRSEYTSSNLAFESTAIPVVVRA